MKYSLNVMWDTIKVYVQLDWKKETRMKMGQKKYLTRY